MKSERMWSGKEGKNTRKQGGKTEQNKWKEKREGKGIDELGRKQEWNNEDW